MAVNSDKPHLWKKDIAASVDLYNDWFMKFAPEAYKKTRIVATEQVKQALEWTDDLRTLSPELLKKHPEALPMLRMATAPPIARDRLIGLAGVNSNLVRKMELTNRLPPSIPDKELTTQLNAICRVIRHLLDADIFPWLGSKANPAAIERERSATIVADRLCGAVADPIIRNAQEQRQLKVLADFLTQHGYKKIPAGAKTIAIEMPDKTFGFRQNLPVRNENGRKINIPVDVVVQRSRKGRKDKFPLLIEAKSAGDFTNVNKRRKEEAMKINQLRKTYGSKVEYILFLCGYFDSGYLGYEAAEGIDWVWEHRIEDLEKFKL